MGRLIFRAFQCETEMDYITVSRLLIVPVIGVARGFPEGPCPPNV